MPHKDTTSESERLCLEPSAFYLAHAKCSVFVSCCDSRGSKSLVPFNLYLLISLCFSTTKKKRKKSIVIIERVCMPEAALRWRPASEQADNETMTMTQTHPVPGLVARKGWGVSKFHSRERGQDVASKAQILDPGHAIDSQFLAG